MPASPARNGADVLLQQLDIQGVDCVFASPIAVMAPIWESLARRGDAHGLRYFRCRHEVLAVGLAAGYYKATGRSQVVFLPSSLGVQNGSMGLHTALQERIPMTVLSPDTFSYGEDPDADPGPEWPSLLVDLVGPARNAEAVVKWAHRARTPSEMVNELRRACFIAQSVPLGPTLLEIPADLLMGPVPAEIPAWVDPAPVVAAAGQVEEAARILSGATNPVIVTEHGGRNDQERAALVSIAESLSAPVFEFMMPAYHNFPRSHPLYGAGPVEDILADVDAVLLAGCNAPWHPPRQSLKPGCAVIHLDEDPLRPRAAYWGYATTHAIPGSIGHNLQALAGCLAGRNAPRPDRVRRWADHTAAVRALGRHSADEARSEAIDFVPAADLFGALHEALPDDAICVDEIVAQVPQMLQFLYERKPLTQIRGWAGALGMSLGTALGAKLADPNRTVVAIVGDGAFHYNPVSAALGFAQEYRLPLLIVLCNNEQYASQTWNVLRYYPDSEAVRDGNFVGDVIDPTPDYVKVVEAYGGTGERVRSAETLGPALQRALQAVSSGQTFLLDVIVKP
ncbi:MAG: thiamine pyrophosphate-binding protein [Mycobacterium sp.]|mgnify:CR=1 FL=1